MATIVYRGPFQGRRLRFLIDAAARVHGELDLFWLNPEFDAADPKPWARALAEDRKFLTTSEELNGSWSAAPKVLGDLRRRSRRGDVVYAIGYTSIPYARAIRPGKLVWAINGIPEERLLHDSSARSRAFVRAEWFGARFVARPDLVIVVSDPMGRFVARHIPGVRWAKAPTCVDVETFGAVPPDPARRFMTYVGSAAPWQALDILAPVWRAIADLDPSTCFRIVSRDARARELAAALPASRVETMSGSAPEIAGMLWETELGFLIRRPDIVNETSFPTKFGEYVAAGVPVISSDVGWEVADIIRSTGCGLVVDWAGDPQVVARQVLEFRDRAARDPSVAEGCKRATAGLGRDVWIDKLAAALDRELTDRPSSTDAPPGVA